MRIISDFKDYYDYIMQYGSDPKIIYDRKTSIHKKKYSSRLLPCGNSLTYYVGSTSIYFCKKLYFGYYIKDKTYKTISKYCYTLDQLDKEINRLLPKKVISDWYTKTYKRNRMINYNKASLSNGRHFDVRETNSFYFSEYMSPVIIEADSEIIVNPRLSDYNFYNTIPAEQAFQDISQFLSNYSFEEKIPKYKGDKISKIIPDKIMAEIKSFDKNSFRKQKTRNKK